MFPEKKKFFWSWPTSSATMQKFLQNFKNSKNDEKWHNWAYRIGEVAQLQKKIFGKTFYINVSLCKITCWYHSHSSLGKSKHFNFFAFFSFKIITEGFTKDFMIKTKSFRKNRAIFSPNMVWGYAVDKIGL